MLIFRRSILFVIPFTVLACHEQPKQASALISPAVPQQENKPFQDVINKPQYRRLTAAIIDTIPDADIEDAVMANIWYKMDDDLSNEYEVAKTLSKPRRVIFITREVEDEVDNGGFNQFFFNSTYMVAADMEDAFKSIGAVKYASVVRRANAIYQRDTMKFVRLRDAGADAFSKSYKNNPLNKLDDEFYALKENLSQLKITYIRKNKAAFIDE